MKETPTGWWKAEPVGGVSDVISLWNDARFESDSVRGFDVLSKAANGLWTQLNRYEKHNGFLPPECQAKGRGDTASFEQLLKTSLSNDEKRRIAESSELAALVNLRPTVMSHDVLRRENYDPMRIPDSIRKKASEKHSELADAFQKYSTTRSDECLDKVVKKLADLLFVIRSNIAHGEKTPCGPDLNKTRRDQEVCRCARPVMEMILCGIFDRPDRRLAVYGTLAPGGANHVRLSNLPGTWFDARLSGHVNARDGLPYFIWDLSDPEIRAKILDSEKLEQSWPDLDRFEGQSYQRMLVVVTVDGVGLSVANIYADSRKVIQ